MYSLFWKIFITYWFTILLIELLTVWVTVELSEYEIHPILEQQHAKFVTNSEKAISNLETGGLQSLNAWLKLGRNREAIDEIYIFDKYNNEINNAILPDNIVDFLDNRHANESLNNPYQSLNNILLFNVIDPKKVEYTVISTFKHPHLIKYLLAPQRVAFGVMISGLICFLLARYFTSPIVKLRRLTQMITSGDFSTVGLERFRSRNDEFGALAIDFETMTARLQELLDTQRQLLQDISHELRSPLARIRIAVGLARNRYSSMDSEELDRVEREIEQLEFLVRELLTFVRIAPKKNSTSLSKVDIREILQHIVEDSKYEQQKIQVKNNINLHCSPGIEVDADAHLLHRAIENIVRNACYYTPEGSDIHIHCTSDNNTVTIAIEDEGPGVPENMLHKIFQPFVRVSSAREADTGGSGIGLAIAKRVIDIHHGTITAKNKNQNGGLIVTIALPTQI